jgi:hypothetical protein
VPKPQYDQKGQLHPAGRIPRMEEKNGGDDETRTRDLCRDSVAWLGFTTT